MRTVEKITDNRWLNIFSVKDPEHGVNGYQYAERLGKDSIAFICYDSAEDLYLVNKEFTPPTGEFMLRAFGGSLDKDVDIKQIVLDEVKEEAGFNVTKDYIFSVGTVFVSTQMNQTCHLYLVYVSKGEQAERHPQNACEALAEPQWLSKDEIVAGGDWKAITILAKAESQYY
jgi:hypothetical protein